ncbi:MAG: hypothetical protein AB1831_01570 [Pseudomonadota bacterium]
MGLRLLLCLPPLFWAAWAWGQDYGQFFLPLYRVVLDLALPDFGVLSLEIGHAQELVFKTQVIAERMIVVQGRALPAGLTVDSHTPLFTVLIHPIVLCAAALAWPGLAPPHRLLRLGLSLPFLVVLECLDTPLVFASSIHDLLSYSLNPAADQASRLIDWVRVLDGGGRFALCVAAAFAAAGLQGLVVGRLSHSAHASPRARALKP